MYDDVVIGVRDFRTPLAGPVELLHRPRPSSRQLQLRHTVPQRTGVPTEVAAGWVDKQWRRIWDYEC